MIYFFDPNKKKAGWAADTSKMPAGTFQVTLYDVNGKRAWAKIGKESAFEAENPGAKRWTAQTTAPPTTTATSPATTPQAEKKAPAQPLDLSMRKTPGMAATTTQKPDFNAFWGAIKSGDTAALKQQTAPQSVNLDTYDKNRVAAAGQKKALQEAQEQGVAKQRINSGVAQLEKYANELRGLIESGTGDPERIKYLQDMVKFYSDTILPSRMSFQGEWEREVAAEVRNIAKKSPFLAATIGQFISGVQMGAAGPGLVLFGTQNKGAQTLFGIREGLSQTLSDNGKFAGDIGSAFYSLGLVAPMTIGMVSMALGTGGAGAAPMAQVYAQLLRTSGTVSMGTSIAADKMREYYQSDGFLSTKEKITALTIGTAQALLERGFTGSQIGILTRAYRVGGEAALKQATAQLVQKTMWPTITQQLGAQAINIGQEIIEENTQDASDIIQENVILGKPIPGKEELIERFKRNTIGAIYGYVLQGGLTTGIIMRQSRVSKVQLANLSETYKSAGLIQNALNMAQSGNFEGAQVELEKAVKAADMEGHHQTIDKAIANVTDAVNLYKTQTALNSKLQTDQLTQDIELLQQEQKLVEGKADPEAQQRAVEISDEIETKQAQIVEIQRKVAADEEIQKLVEMFVEGSSEAEVKKQFISSELAQGKTTEQAETKWSEMQAKQAAKMGKPTEAVNDQENQQGLPSEEREGQEPVQAQPIQTPSSQAAKAGGVVQTPQGEEVTRPTKDEVRQKRREENEREKQRADRRKVKPTSVREAFSNTKFVGEAIEHPDGKEKTLLESANKLIALLPLTVGDMTIDPNGIMYFGDGYWRIAYTNWEENTGNAFPIDLSKISEMSDNEITDAIKKAMTINNILGREQGSGSQAAGYKIAVRGHDEFGETFTQETVENAAPVLKIEHPELDLFIHREIYNSGEKGNWIVSTNLTGGRVSTGKTRNEAIEVAKKRIAKLIGKYGSIDNVIAEINKSVESDNAEREARRADAKAKAKATHIYDWDTWHRGISDAEYRDNLEKVIKELKQAKDNGYKYAKESRWDNVSDIDDMISIYEDKLLTITEPDSFKRNVYTWKKYHDLENLKRELSFYETQLTKPNDAYKLKPKEEIAETIREIKEAIRQVEQEPTETPKPKKAAEPEQAQGKLFDEKAVEASTTNIPDSVAEEALLKLFKNHVASVTHEGRTMRVKFNDGRELELNRRTGIIEVWQNGKLVKRAIGETRAESVKGSIRVIVDLVDGFNGGNRTLFHEAFHVAWKLFLTQEQIDFITQAYGKKLGTTDMESIEEAAANAAENWLLKRSTATTEGKIWQRFWDRVRNALIALKLAPKGARLQDIFYQLEQGKLTGKGTQEAGSRAKVLGTTAARALDKANGNTYLMDNKALAIQMEAQYGKKANSKKAKLDIWRATGWEKGTDGVWKFEKGDGKLIYDGKRTLDKPTTLKEIWDDPELYQAYPQFADTPVVWDEAYFEGTGAFDGDTIHVGTTNRQTDRAYTYGGNEQQQRDIYEPVLIHEIQHMVQETEGFAKGGSSLLPIQQKMLRLDAEYNALVDKTSERAQQVNRELQAAIQEYRKKSASGPTNRDFKEYQRIAGEVEARNVVARRGMTEAQRKKKAPFQTEDVSRKKQRLTGVKEQGEAIRYKKLEEKNLVTIHNIPVDSIEKVSARGGMVMPSIAIIDATKTKFSGFGDASLLGTEKMINVSAKEPLYTSDAYTPHYPQVKQIVARDAKLWAMVDHLNSITDGKIHWSTLYENIKEEGLESAVTFMIRHHSEYSYEKSKKLAQKAISDYPLNIEEHLKAGLDRNGNERLVKHTLYNALKIMKEDAKRESNVIWGTSNLRGILAPKFRSLAQAKANRESILSKEEMEKIEEDTNKLFETVAERSARVRKNTGFIYHFDIASDISDMARRGWGSIADLYKNDSVRSDYEKVIDHMRNLPTQYFEYKPQRVVGLNEFVAAIVPKGTKATTTRALRGAGLKVVRYDATDENARYEAVKKVSEELGIRYKTLPTSAEIAEAERQYREVEQQYKGTDKWLKAPNGKVSNLNERQWVQVRTPLFKAWFGDWENDPANASKVVDENGEPLLVFSGYRRYEDEYYRDWEFDDKDTYPSPEYDYPFPDDSFINTVWGTDKYDMAALFASEGKAKGYHDAVAVDYVNIKNKLPKRTVRFEDYGGEYRIKPDKNNDGMYVFEYKDDYGDWIESDPGYIYTNFMNIRNPYIVDDKGYNWYDLPMPEQMRADDFDESEYKIGTYDYDEDTVTTSGFAKYIKENTTHDGVIYKNIYDGNHRSTVYAAFNGKNQIKSATANVGTFSSENADIRYKPAPKPRELTQAQKETLAWIEVLYEELYQPTKTATDEPVKRAPVVSRPPEVTAPIYDHVQPPANSIQPKGIQPTQAEIDAIVKKMASGKYDEQEVADILGRQIIASQEVNDKSLAALLTAARITNFPERAESRTPAGTEGTIKWSYEAMKEYAASRNLSVPQLMEVLQKTRFDAVANGIGLYDGMKDLQQRILDIDELLQTEKNIDTIAELNKAQAILYGELGVFEQAYDMQSEMAGRILFTRKMQKAEMLEQLRKLAENKARQVMHDRNEIAEMKAKIDELRKKQANLEKSWKALTEIMDKTLRFKSFDELTPGEQQTEAMKVWSELQDTINQADNMQQQMDDRISFLQAHEGDLQNLHKRLAKARKDGRKPTPTDIPKRKLSLYDYTKTLVYNLMLSGLPTHIINFGSNWMNHIAETYLVNTLTNPKSAAMSWVKSWGAIPEAFVDAIKTFRNPEHYAKKYGVEHAGSRIVETKLYKVINANLRLMAAEDAFWRVVNYRSQLWTLAYAEAKRTGRKTKDLFRDPTPEIRKMALYEAERATFNQNPEGFMGVLSGLIDSGYRAMEKYEGKGQAITKSTALLLRLNVMPFTRIVASVANAQLDYAPLAGLKRAFEYKITDPDYYLNKQISQGWENESIDPYRRRMFARQLARQAIGVILIGALFKMIADRADDDDDKWIISGYLTNDPVKRDQLRKAGVLPNSLHIGNAVIPYGEWSIGGALAIIGNIHDHIKYNKGGEKESLSKLIGAGFMGIIKSFQDRNFISGLENTLTAIDRGDEDWLRRQSAKTASAPLAWRFVQNINQMFADKDVHKPETWWQDFWNNVPFGTQIYEISPSKEMPDAITEYGEVKKRAGLLERFIGIRSDRTRNVPEDLFEVAQAMAKAKFRVSQTMARRARVGTKEYIPLRGEDLELFRVLRGEEMSRYLIDNKDFIVNAQKNGQMTELKSEMASWGTMSTRRASEQIKQLWQDGKLKYKYKSYILSEDEGDQE